MKYLFITVLILLTMVSKAQEKRKNISVSYGIGNGDITNYKNLGVGGMSSNKGKSLHIFGFNYYDEVSKNLYVETGFSVLKHNYDLSIYKVGMVGITTSSTPQTISSLTIPLKLRFEFGKYFFLNGGLMADFGLKKTEEYMSDISGMGVGLGLGLQYYYKNAIGVIVNPQINAHGLLGFGSTNGIFEKNLTFGLAYRIK